MLTGLIFFLRMTICPVTKFFHLIKDFYVPTFLPSIKLNLLLLFFCFAFKLFWYVFKMFFFGLPALNFVVGVITNLQSLNPELTGKPNVC